MLKPAPKAEETALCAWFCLEILLRENIIISEFFVTKRLAVGNLCHVFGAPTLENSLFQNQALTNSPLEIIPTIELLEKPSPGIGSEPNRLGWEWEIRIFTGTIGMGMGNALISWVDHGNNIYTGT